MMTIGSKLALIIFVMETMSTAFMNDEERKQFYRDILEAHNNARSWHHTGPLELNQTICNKLKEHTDKLEANQESQIPSEYGTNIFKLDFEDKPILYGKGIVQLWYHTVHSYDFFTEPESPSKEIDEFTQMLWNDSKYIGVGTLIKGNKCSIIVAYSPKGNIRGQYLKNVFLPHPSIRTLNIK